MIIQIETSCNTIDELLNKARDASRKQKTVIQVFDPDAVLSKKHLKYSFSQAFKACEQRKNIAKTLENEFLLRTAATRKISEAIKRTGVKNTKKALLAIDTNDGKKINKILEQLNAKQTKLSFPSEKTIAKLYELNENALKNYTVEQLLLEKIALLEIED